MKKSRLNLFKLTSMSISVLGYPLYYYSYLVIAGIGIWAVTQSVSKGCWKWSQLMIN